MAWSQLDIDKVRAAVLKLASGELAVLVEFDGPPRRKVEYGQAKLSELRALLSDMEASQSTQSPGGLVITPTVYNKGFTR